MKYNNAESTLSADITASATSIVLKTGEGDLFPSTGYPEKMKIEHFEGGVVTKREVLTISGRTGDILTISSRASEACVQDESLATKTRTQDAFSFSSGDTISMTITEDDYNGIIEELETNIPDTYATKDEVKKGELNYYESTNGTDSYTITIPGITAYTDGLEVKVKADVSNTGICTLNVNGLGAKSVKKQQGTVDLVDGDWGVNGIATLVYNSDLDVFQFEGEIVNTVDVNVSSTSSDFVCGESISAGEPLVNGEPVNISYETFSTEYLLGYDNTNYEYAQSITVGSNDMYLNEIFFGLRKNGSPTFIINAEVFSDTGSTLLGSSIGTISSSDVNTTFGLINTSFKFNSIKLNASTQYFIKINIVSGSVSSTNYLRIGYGSNGYGGGTGYRVNNSNSWSDLGVDLSFKLFGTNKNGKAYLMDTSNGNSIDFLGFSKGSGVLDDTIGIDTAGVVGNQSSLIPGATYYGSDTPGTISTVPGTNEVKVGKAISETEILINTGGF